MGQILRFTPRPPRPPGGTGPGLPPGPVLRAEIEAGAQAALDVADHFIALLDRMDGCPDDEDGGEDEPCLAAPENHHASQVTWMRGNDQDYEAEAPEVVLPECDVRCAGRCDAESGASVVCRDPLDPHDAG